MEEAYFWILSCIESSKDGFQFKCCATLIELFEAMYKAENETIDLKFALDEKKIKHGIEI